MNQPYNFEETIDGIRLCRGNHERCEPCQFEEFISLDKYKALIIKVSELENELILRQDAVNKSQERLCEIVKMEAERDALRAKNTLLVEEMRERPIYRKPYKEPTHKKECGTCIHSTKDFPLASNPMFCECVPAWVEAKPKIKVDPSIAERCPTYTEVDCPF